MDQLLTIDQAAEVLGTGERFVRRLIAERRIRFHKLGRHVRIAASDLDAFITAGVVDPVGEWTVLRRGRPRGLVMDRRTAS